MNGLPTEWLVLAAALLGLIAGSFLSTCVVRWPLQQSVRGRSACDHCQRILSWRDLVPLFSWLLAHGRCRSCHKPIDTRHLLFEVACALIATIAISVSPDWIGVGGALLGWLLIALIALDLHHYWLPNAFTYPLLGLGMWLSPVPMPDRWIGGLVGGGLFLALFGISKYARGQEAIGLGDVKMMAALGVWLGWQHLPFLLLFSSLIGLLMALIKHLRPTSPKDPRIPFGACLALCAYPLWIHLAAHAI